MRWIGVDIRAFSRRFADPVRARWALGEDTLPVIRLQDLRPTHATFLLATACR